MKKHPFWYVYTVRNTVNGKRYVGKTSNPARRWQQHTSASRRHTTTSKLHDAIRKYGADAFIIRVEERFCSESDAFDCERSLIATFGTCRDGYNITDGGGGVSSLPEETTRLRAQRISAALKGRPRSRAAVEATAAALRGRKRDPAIGRAISLAKRGKPITEAQRWAAANARAHWSGRHTDVTRAKMSATRLGKPCGHDGRKTTVETRRKISATKTPKLSDFDVVAIRHASAGGETRTSLADRYGVDISLISQIAIGKARTLAGGPITERLPLGGPSRRPVSPEVKQQVITLRKTGLTMRAIAKECGLVSGTVCKIIQEPLKE